MPSTGLNVKAKKSSVTLVLVHLHVGSVELPGPHKAYAAVGEKLDIFLINTIIIADRLTALLIFDDRRTVIWHRQEC